MSTVSSEIKEKFAAILHDSGILKFGEFTLKSGIVSPFYLNFHQALSFPDTFATLVDVYAEMLSDVDPKIFLTGIPEGGTPLMAATGYKVRRPLLQLRKQAKDHGMKTSVDGDFKPGDKVVILDDLITKGDSKFEAIKQCEDAGLVVDKLIVLVDREQGGIEAMKTAGYTLEAAFGISELIESLLSQNKISQEQHDTVLDFIKNN